MTPLRALLPLVHALLVAFAIAAMPAAARADGQVSLRTVLGAGKRWVEAGNEAVFDTGLRGDVMFGKPEREKFRIGPAFELRTVDFASLEGAVGGGVLIPLPGDFPIGLNGLVGYAARRRATDGAMGIGTVTWGYRGYNYEHWYGWGLNVYVSARKSLTGSDLTEITGGVEVDIMFTTIIPLLAMMDMFP